MPKKDYNKEAEEFNNKYAVLGADITAEKMQSIDETIENSKYQDVMSKLAGND